MKLFFSKKIVALAVAVVMCVSAASAVEFTVGGRAFGDVRFYKQFINIDGKVTPEKLDTGEDAVYMDIGLGGSVFAGIDFVTLGKVKLGVRPEAGMFATVFSDNDDSSGGLGFVLRLPATVTFSVNDNFDIGAGVGVGIWDDFALALDVFAAFKAGPGKILVDISCDPKFAQNFLPTLCFGAGYQYTF